jgi:hypothetical protein
MGLAHYAASQITSAVIMPPGAAGAGRDTLSCHGGAAGGDHELHVLHPPREADAGDHAGLHGPARVGPKCAEVRGRRAKRILNGRGAMGTPGRAVSAALTRSTDLP